MNDPRPAYYAAARGGWRDWWTVLHPPYTAWHLGYVVIGASLAPHVRTDRMVGCVVAFFLAVGVSAHALDELHGRPLRTSIPDRALVGATVLGLAGAVAIGIVGVTRIGLAVVPFLVVGPVLVAGYNAELLGGVLHNDLGFAASWGAFPVLSAYVAETGRLSWAAGLGAAAALLLSLAQRALSTPARHWRRNVQQVSGTIEEVDGSRRGVDRALMLAPLERALRALSWSVVCLAAALAVARLG